MDSAPRYVLMVANFQRSSTEPQPENNHIKNELFRICERYCTVTSLYKVVIIILISEGGPPGPGGHPNSGHPNSGDPWAMTNTNTSLPGGSYSSSSMLPSSAQYSQASSYPMGHRENMVSLKISSKSHH
jgi:hypothetical protein